ncbi:MAG: hypothetical protein H6Q73_302 [Firmicutes bacterium]|nr:hypothetical protein [Bacillota bacterium]
MRCCRYESGNINPYSDVWLNCQKSAEVILPRWIYTLWEGPNNRRFPKFERHDEITVQGVIALSEQVKGLFSGVREDIEDLVSEAQFENLKQSIDAGIVEEPIATGAAETGVPIGPDSE